jgi:hypothetical protein
MSEVEVVKTIPDDDGSREVRIVRNSNGSFGFEEWGIYAYPGGEAGSPMGPNIRTFADTAETAEREARARVDWLIPVRDSN